MKKKNSGVEIRIRRIMSTVRSAQDIDVDDEREYREEKLYNSLNSLNKRPHNDKYTNKYRLIKTLLLILAWICLGINLEMIGPTLEDLKIYLDANYSTISFGLILRNSGYLVLTILFGLILDKVLNYSEALMAISSATLALGKLLSS